MVNRYFLFCPRVTEAAVEAVLCTFNMIFYKVEFTVFLHAEMLI